MKKRWIALAAAGVLLAGCQTTALKPMATVREVDIDRFMGAWYVIANIPTFIEKDAYGAVDSYRRQPDGTVDITYTYRAGSFEGEMKTLRSKGFVEDASNAVWGVQFVWPFKADYRITHLADDYSQTVIAREKRDYVWIMARTPTISDADYQRLLAVVADRGYDSARVQRVPQKRN